MGGHEVFCRFGNLQFRLEGLEVIKYYVDFTAYRPNGGGGGSEYILKFATFIVVGEGGKKYFVDFATCNSERGGRKVFCRFRHMGCMYIVQCTYFVDFTEGWGQEVFCRFH